MKEFQELNPLNLVCINTTRDFETLKYFELLSIIGEISLHSGRLKTAISNLLEADIGKKSKILEVGSGTGATTSLLLKMGINVECIEPLKNFVYATSYNCLKQAKRIPKIYNSTLEDVQDIPDETYDIILLECVFGFIQDKSKVIKQLLKLLKKNGKIVVNDFFYKRSINKNLKQSLSKKLGINQFLTKKQWSQFFDYFTQLSYREMLPINHEITYDMVESSIKRADLFDKFPKGRNGIAKIVELLQNYESLFKENRAYMTSFQTILEKKQENIIFIEKLETDRIILKNINIDDAKYINNAIIASYERLKEWVFWAKDMCDLKKCEQWCSETYNKFIHAEELHMVIIDKESNRVVGMVGLFSINWNTKTCNIGYWGDTRFQSKGFISEAVKCITAYALDTIRINCILLTSDERNIKSHRVAELAGYKYEKTLYNNQKNVEGCLRNTKIYFKKRI